MFIVQGNHNKKGRAATARAECEHMLSALPAVLSTDGAEYPVIVHTDYGAGVVYEKAPRRSFDHSDREACKISYAEKDHMACLALSRIKRTMADANLLSSMGLSADNTDPNAAAPTDAALLCGHLGKVFAKQRWEKAGNVLGAIRALKAGGGLSAALGKAAGGGEEKKDEPESRPQMRGSLKRLSITNLDVPQADANKDLPKLPPDADLIEMLSKINGQFAFCVQETARDFVFVARTDSPRTELYWGRLPDGTLLFGSVVACFPPESNAEEFPPNSYFVGRAADASAVPKPFR